MTDAQNAGMLGRSSDGRLVQRPLSPHLQVYRWPLSMATSILHRVTGCALSVGALLLVWWLVAAADGDAAYDAVSGFLRSVVGIVLLFGWTVALWFHFCAGLRHLAWDAGLGFDLPATDRNGIVILAATAVLTVLTWIVVVIVW